MKKVILDLFVNELTGETHIIVDFNDASMTAFEMNQAIKSGEILEEVLKQTATIFGEEIANDVRSGKIEAICLDNNPHLRPGGLGVLTPEAQAENEKSKIEIKQ